MGKWQRYDELLAALLEELRRITGRKFSPSATLGDVAGLGPLNPDITGREDVVGADSLDLLELVMHFEEYFDQAIDDSLIRRETTVEQIAVSIWEGKT